MAQPSVYKTCIIDTVLNIEKKLCWRVSLNFNVKFQKEPLSFIIPTPQRLDGAKMNNHHLSHGFLQQETWLLNLGLCSSETPDLSLCCGRHNSQDMVACLLPSSWIGFCSWQMLQMSPMTPLTTALLGSSRYGSLLEQKVMLLKQLLSSRVLGLGKELKSLGNPQLPQSQERPGQLSENPAGGSRLMVGLKLPAGSRAQSMFITGFNLFPVLCSSI